ncbi:MAG TPA: hypothetical protein VF035_04600 [Longimicrobiales bacterium]
MTDTLDARFADAVGAIDNGDEAALRAIIAAHPWVVTERLSDPGSWLRDQTGNAADGFFSRPWLLWFVAEDPERNGTLPPNVTAIASIIIDAARRQQPDDFQEMLDSTLRLVCWSGVAARCGVQIALIDVLIDAGAIPASNANNALVNGHMEAAEHLVARGGELTLAAALCLGRWDDVARIAEASTPEVRQFSFVMAALNGRADAVAWMIRDGIPVNEPSGALYSHGTPLHHAVCSGSLETSRGGRGRPAPR